MQERGKAITDLCVHPEYPVFGLDRAGKPTLLFKYVADFGFTRDGNEIIEDVKPSHDPASWDAVFKLKRRAVEKTYGIEISIYSGS